MQKSPAVRTHDRAPDPHHDSKFQPTRSKTSVHEQHNPINARALIELDIQIRAEIAMIQALANFPALEDDENWDDDYVIELGAPLMPQECLPDTPQLTAWDRWRCDVRNPD